MKVNIGPYPNGNKSRKQEVHVERYDTYSMDHTLALIILPMLVQLKETKHGVQIEFTDPGGADYDAQDSFDFYKETHNDAFNQKAEMWDDVLDKMIWSFQELLDEDYDSKYHHGKMQHEWKELDETELNPLTGKKEKMFQMVDKNPDEHWYDYVGHQEHEARIREGLELFGKHFRSLWD